MRDQDIVFDLLRTGDIDLSTDVAKAFGQDQSLTQIRRIGLVKGELRIRAAFRDKTDTKLKEGKLTYNDAYYHELAAYVISQYLGLNIVPPTIARSIAISEEGLLPGTELRPGTLQLWVENSNILFNFIDTDLTYPGLKEYKNQQIREIKAFDCIIGNVDRHAGNLLVDLNERYEKPASKVSDNEPYLGKIWAIDHSRSFYKGAIRGVKVCRLSKLKENAISLQFARGMRTWKIEELERLLLESGLTERQLNSIRLKSIESRFQKVKEHFEDEQADSGLSDEEFYTSGIWHRVW